MSLFSFRTSGTAILLATFVVQAAVAAGPNRYPASYPNAAYAAPVRTAAHVPPAAQLGVNAHYGQYPQLNAPLYPAPQQNIPSWNGGAIITNQALAPHEMLYPHEYHAMYPPFYYKVTGGWIWTPHGMRQHEKWKLQGTEVKVKYRSHYKFLSGFHPPR